MVNSAKFILETRYPSKSNYLSETDRSSRYRSSVQKNFGLKFVSSVITSSMTDESSVDKFGAKISLNTKFISRRFIGLRQIIRLQFKFSQCKQKHCH